MLHVQFILAQPFIVQYLTTPYSTSCAWHSQIQEAMPSII